MNGPSNDGARSVRRRRIGIKDVAKAAGVSITTVSHALSGKGRLTDETRERVRRVADDLGYTPHPVAQSLASGRTGMIAVVVSLPGNAPIAFTQIDYYVALINAATRTAVGRGYALVVAPSTSGPATWGRLPLDGVIVIDPADGDPTLPMIRGRGVPIVFVGRDPNGLPDDLVVENDRASATRSVLDHLVDAGARTVALMGLRTFESFTEDALAAHTAWSEERGREPLVHAVDADSTASAGEFRAGALSLLASDDRPDAVFCLYERQAVELLAAARETGVDVPAEMLVATIAEMGLAASSHPGLTTLELNQDELGVAAASLLIDRLEGRPAASVRDVPTTITIRGSTRR
ncbi:MAG: LacI family DNA-binding transcriptional regulator [Actinomycetota bacterium]